MAHRAPRTQAIVERGVSYLVKAGLREGNRYGVHVVTRPRLEGRQSGRRPAQPAVEPAAILEAPLGPAFVLLSHDEIAARAYEYYEARGRSAGHADADWHRAVSELRQPK